MPELPSAIAARMRLALGAGFPDGGFNSREFARAVSRKSALISRFFKDAALHELPVRRTPGRVPLHDRPDADRGEDRQPVHAALAIGGVCSDSTA